MQWFYRKWSLKALHSSVLSSANWITLCNCSWLTLVTEMIHTYGRIALHWMHVLRWLLYFHRENQQRKVMGSLIASEQICMLWSFHIWGKSFYYCSWMWLYHLWLVWHSICLTVDLPYWSYSFQESQLSGLIHQLYMVIFNPPLSDGYI